MIRCAALVSLVSLALLGCASEVDDARRDSVARRRVLTAPPDISPPAQTCDDTTPCALVYGVPGMTLEGLCCATCEPPAALSLDTAAAVATWKEGLDCRQVTCLPGCPDAPADPWEAACIDGRCVRVP